MRFVDLKRLVNEFSVKSEDDKRNEILSKLSGNISNWEKRLFVEWIRCTRYVTFVSPTQMWTIPQVHSLLVEDKVSKTFIISEDIFQQYYNAFNAQMMECQKNKVPVCDAKQIAWEAVTNGFIPSK